MSMITGHLVHIFESLCISFDCDTAHQLAAVAIICETGLPALGVGCDSADINACISLQDSMLLTHETLRLMWFRSRQGKVANCAH